MRWVADALADAGLVLRLARRCPLFVGTTVLVLGLGIGATTAVYSVVRQLVLQPLPYPEPDRLVHLITQSPDGVTRLSSAPQFLHWRLEGAQRFEALAAVQDRAPSLTLTVHGRAVPVRTLRVSADYFDVFRAPWVRGRAFSRGEDATTGPGVIVISHGFWRRYYGAADVLGQSLWLANEPHEIVGILGPGFTADPDADIFVPLRATARREDHTRQLRVVGRLRPASSIDAARREIVETTAAFRRTYPFALRQHEGFSAETLHAVMVGPIIPTLRLIGSAVILVLLVACANVATLLLSRGQLRTCEVAARSALGASRPRIIRQLLTESTCLALAGAALALPMAWLALEILAGVGLTSLPPSMQRLADGVSLDLRVIVVAMAIGLLTGGLCGLVPAMVTSRPDLSAMFKSAGTQAAASWRGGNAQTVLLLAEVAAAVVLLSVTIIVLESVARLRALDRGFDPTNVLTIEMPLIGTRFSSGEPLDVAVRNVLTRLADMGGVSAAAATFVLPTDQGAMTPFVLNDRPLFARGAHHGAVRWEIVTAEYFTTLRIRRLDGRLFSADDRRGAPPVAVVNRAMARRYWGDRSAVRERVTMGAADQRAVDQMREIVGVVDDVRGRDGSPAEPTVYIPLSQASDRMLAAQQTRTPLRWIVRVASDPALVASGVASAIERSAQGASVLVMPSMSELLAEQAERARFTLQLLSAFAVLAVLLALVGVYGFVANAVAQRTKELSIRSALGASSADLLRLVSRQGAQIVLGGALVGIAAAAMIGAVSEHVVVGARALDPATLVILAVSQAVAAAIATFMAARPAMHVDPRRVVD